MDQLDTADLGSLSPEMADALPEEIKQLIELQREKQLQQVEQIGQAIAKKRDEAVKARAASGVEEIWLEDEEAYQGIDDANRNEAKAYKPAHPSGSFSTVKRDPSRSTVFLNITRPYVDAASARVADMLMPTDDKNWAIKHTPIPDLEAAVKQAMEHQAQQPMPQQAPPMAGGQMPPMAAGMPQPQGMPPQAATQMPGAMPMPGMPATLDEATKIIEEAKKRAEAAEKRIEDWLVQSNWHAEMRKVMEDCSRLGTGIIKGPTPVRRKNYQFSGQALEMSISIDPESRRIDPWNFYPDPACNEDIHEGSYTFEKDSISTRKLRELKDLPGYLADQIDLIIEEGPGKMYADDGRPDQRSQNDDEKYEIWYYYGILDRDDLESLGVDPEESNLAGVPAIVTLVNDRAIKAALNPLDSGEFPYDVIPWQRRSGHWTGVGVSRQIRTPQRMINACTRNMLDNAGLSGGPILIVRRNLVEPADGNWSLTPRKLFYVKEEGDVRAVADAITSIIIPSNQGEMTNIIQFALKMAEDVTGLPMIMQGQQGQAPDTVGGMQMMQNNASTVLRRIARSFDDCITEPHIRRYYNWLMMYGEDSEKGDFQIDARGSSALVERDIQNQAIMGLVNLTANPAFGLDPEKCIAEALKAQRLDPKRFQMDEQKKAQMAQMPPPQAPQVQAAQIRAQADQAKTQMVLQAGQAEKQMELQAEREIAQIENATLQTKIKVDTDRDTALVNAQHEKNTNDANLRMQELQIKKEIELLKYSTQQNISLEKAKTDLARDAMKLRVTKELAEASNAMDIHKHRTPAAKPIIEPPGRASPGQAFSQ